MYVKITNEMGRPILINSKQIAYVEVIANGVFIDYYSGSGAVKTLTQNPSEIASLLAFLSQMPHILDLRENNLGTLLNIPQIRFADIAEASQTIFVYFLSPTNYATIDIKHRAVLEDALLNYSEAGGGGAPLYSPHFSGVPTAPTPPISSNNTTLATTAFTQSVVQDATDTLYQDLVQNGVPTVPYSKLIDSTDNDTIMYVGEADPGSLPSEAKWRIQKISFIAEDTVIGWAEGSGLFDKVWNDRLSYSYS